VRPDTLFEPEMTDTALSSGRLLVGEFVGFDIGSPYLHPRG
jgi:hypothetical protein